MVAGALQQQAGAQQATFDGLAEEVERSRAAEGAGRKGGWLQ